MNAILVSVYGNEKAVTMQSYRGPFAYIMNTEHRAANILRAYVDTLVCVDIANHRRTMDKVDAPHGIGLCVSHIIPFSPFLQDVFSMKHIQEIGVVTYLSDKGILLENMPNFSVDDVANVGYDVEALVIIDMAENIKAIANQTIGPDATGLSQN